MNPLWHPPRPRPRGDRFARTHAGPPSEASGRRPHEEGVQTRRQPDGMVLNNADEQPHRLSTSCKPKWLKAKLPGGRATTGSRTSARAQTLHGLRRSRLPQHGRVLGPGVATIMILGDTCTRVRVLQRQDGQAPGAGQGRAARVAESLGADGPQARRGYECEPGRAARWRAGIWAETIIRAKEACPTMSIEVLIPDFAVTRRAADGDRCEAAHHQPQHRNGEADVPGQCPSAKFDRSIEFATP